MTASLRLDGKVAIVTGASRGIGESIARTFAAHGAKVVLTARKVDALQAVAKDIDGTAGAGTTLAVASHAGREADCDALVAQAVGHFGKVDVLVNNAATNLHFGPLMTADAAAWDKTFETNLKGYFWMIRAAVKHLQGRSAAGSVVNVASITALEAAPMMGVYAMTKAGIVSMTKTLAVELASSNIRVNAVAPGIIETRFAGALTQNDTISKPQLAKTPLGRFGVPDEVAGAVLYLASDGASYTTGQTLVMDGGVTIS